MWESLGTYDQIFRGCLIGCLYGLPILITYYLVDRILKPHVERMGKLVDKKMEGECGSRADSIN